MKNIRGWLLFVLFIFVSHTFLCAQQLTKADWKEDILQLKQLLETKHINLYHTTPKEVFDREFQKVLGNLNHLDDDQVIIEICRLVALAKDGHTSFYADDQKISEFSSFPICLSQFDDGLFVIASPENMPDINGLQLVAIENTPIADVEKKLIPYIPRDNDAEITYTYPAFIENAKLLYELGITKSKSEAVFVFMNDGEKIFKKIVTVANNAYPKKWIAARESLRGITVSRNPTVLFSNTSTLVKLNGRKNYWTQILDSVKTIVFQYNTCWDQEGQISFKECVNKEVFDFIDKHPDYKLVIDMRNNSGGEPATAGPLIAGIKERPGIFEKHRPVVLVGVRTFSAAATNVLQFKKDCNAILIGQLSRAKPNSPSEGRDFELNHSKCPISISTLMVNRYPEEGNASYMLLDKIIPLRFADYINDKDKTLEEAVKLSAKM